MPTPKNAQSQKTRKKIFDAAASLMKEYGEDYLTIANICEKAGISKGTFFYHFNSKDDLMMYYLKEGFDDYVVSHRTLDEAGEDIFELVVQLYEDYLDYCQEAGIDFISNYYVPKNKALDARGSMGSRETMNLLLKANVDGFEAAQKSGYVRTDWSAEDMAYDCCSIIKGCVFEWCVTDGRIDLIAHMKHMLYAYFANVVTDLYREKFPHDEPPMA